MLLACLMCLALLGAAAVSLAETTTLEVSLTGLTALADGSWRTEGLSGSFEVYQGGEALGRIDVPAQGSASVALKDGGSVTLIPVMDTMPGGYLIYAGGYAVAVTEGRQNLAAMNVCANAGLFTLQAEGAASFTMTAEDGTVLPFATDEHGWYACPEALPSGVYTVHQEEAEEGAEPWPDFLLTVTAYQGAAAEIVAVDRAYAQENAVERQKPVQPTEAPVTTATNAPTEAPTSTPAPTPAAGVLKLLANGSAAYSLALGDDPVAQGTLTADQPEALTGLEPGEYTVTIDIPQGMVMTALNGQALALQHQVQWQAEVKAGIEGTYTITLGALGSISGSVTGVSEAAADLSGVGQAALTDGQYAWTELLPGEYTVTLTLPAGDYAAEGWTLQTREDGVTATITVQAEGDVRLPVVERLANAAVSGRVQKVDGTALSGLTVTLTAADGAAVQTTSDSNGAWRFEGLADGSYTVRAQAVDGMAVKEAAVSLVSGQQVTDVQLTAGAPASLRVHAFQDSNNNGAQGSYERALAGVTVGAVPADDLTAAPVAIAVTDKNGDALLEGLVPGQYVLRAQMPLGYAFTAYGGVGDEKSSVMQETDQQLQDSAVITLAEGQTAVCGIGASSMAVVSGYVWLDENGDGVRQDEEHGQAGCLIELVLRGGETMYQLVTGEDGNYVFGAVKPGEYNIRATTPDGLMFTQYTKYGGDKRSILTTEGVRKATKLVKLSAGKVLDEQNIGLVDQGVIQVQCVLDANFNGLYDEGARPLADVKAELLKQGNGKTVVTKTSDENGMITYEVSMMGTTATMQLEKTSDEAADIQATATSFADGTLTTGDYTITITDYKVIQPGETGNEYSEKPVIAFWYDTTNTGDEADVDPMTAWITVFEAVQDNHPNAVNALNVAGLPDEQFLDSQMQNIKPGGTVANAVAYELDDGTTPVELTARDVMGNAYGSQTYEIAQ